MMEQSYRQNVDAVPQKYEFDQMVTSISLATPLVGMDFTKSDKVLIVATITELRVFYFIKNSKD
jgi:hypothetical protein